MHFAATYDQLRIIDTLAPYLTPRMMNSRQ